MNRAKKHYTLSYGEPRSYGTAKLLLWIASVFAGPFLLQELDVTLGIAWDSTTPITDRLIYDLERMALGAAALLTFLWATRTTAVKITSH